MLFFQHFLCFLVGNLQKPLSLVAESIIKLAKYLIKANEYVENPPWNFYSQFDHPQETWHRCTRPSHLPSKTAAAQPPRKGHQACCLFSHRFWDQSITEQLTKRWNVVEYVKYFPLPKTTVFLCKLTDTPKTWTMLRVHCKRDLIKTESTACVFLCVLPATTPGLDKGTVSSKHSFICRSGGRVFTKGR